MLHDDRREGVKKDIMKPLRTNFILSAALAVAGFGFAQQAPVPEQAQTAPQTQDQTQAQAPAPAPAPAQDGGWHRMGNGTTPAPAQAPDPNYQQNAPAPLPGQTPPPQLTIKPGTYVTVRINQVLSSDRNQAGDAFSATLVRPIVVDGVVVADRGQTLGGKVTEAKKAGRVAGTSRLGVQLTDIPIVDGNQVPVQTSLVSRNGPTSVGRDAFAIGGTTALGAAVGAAADWGRGAAIGAGAGAAVGILGVLLTRGAPTIIPPETVLTFRIEQPVTVSTERAPQAFRFVQPGEYNTQPAPALRPRPGPPYGTPGAGYYAPAYYPYAYPYGYGYPYPYWGWGYPYWGSGVVVGFGRFGWRR